MKLSEILKNISNVDNNLEINNIRFDSRLVEKGDLFVATRGTVVDGHDFIAVAVEKGAVAVVCEKMPQLLSVTDNQLSIIQIENSAAALGKISSNFYGNPSEKLCLVGVTGTNGKTTVATLLYELTMSLGIKAGLLSTVCNCICGQKTEATHTTPNSLDINRLLAEMVQTGCRYCFMEVSSHAVVQHRITGLTFAGGIFTNLTRDHLDYHGTMENYRDAKKMFFDNLPKTSFALTNLDDKNGEFMLQNCKAKRYTCSTCTLADFKTKIIESNFEGMELLIEQRVKNKEQRRFELFTTFVGKFNAQNLTAVFGTAVLLFAKAFLNSSLEDLEGVEIEEILVKLSDLKSVSGRFETIRSNGITAIVDYAHTPDALRNVLDTINDIKLSGSKLITVVGCGGNRDKGKRPLMAQQAVNWSDTAIFTSDNPRNENPQDILNDMLAGLTLVQCDNVLTISNRREAIKTACKLAEPGDIILVAGKGHEDYQIINGIKHHFNDKEEVRNFLERR
ncbi:MAG: UDP-N-acetylmuramoyl-L-alanyl-D-glutamate--2,6-diaminopimelate ligase [Prevotellaceae bacterium]|jgi:UDP-N-acetylmuramoyl-L-alanyl-D-glutamate--2,6-diaminopimelate ligase|nr:UDP-N-acetylmuramoyl-L-alanyl-D-glutamate--2,6-diaminopimelate ligase [Prevotellaceae bacterium]